jgi:hypothetical protein
MLSMPHLNRALTGAGFLAFFFLILPTLARGQEPPPAPLPTIEWDASTLRLIEPRADYGRMARLADGRIACAFDRDRKMWLRISGDGAATWGDPILVAAEERSWLTNASLLPLDDGSLLYFWNDRPLEAIEHEHKPAPPGRLKRPIRIRMARSADNGRTWSAPRTLYAAGPSYRDGCWEPAGLQLPSGEVQVYFSNEFPFQATDEQEIALLRSRDRGRTWSKAERVSLRQGHRDGMPAPLLLADGRGIAVAIEDNGVSAGGVFKPSILSTTLADDWRCAPVDATSPRRRPALATPLDPRWYAGAPFLARLPSGQTLLSFQESPDGTLDRCRLAVCVGDPSAAGFTNKTYPLPLGPTGNQAWNALFVKDAQTVIAVASATVDGQRGVWSVTGRVVLRKQPSTSR